MPSPTELLSCKGKAATADTKYRLKARKRNLFWKPSTIPMELGIPKRFLLSYLAFCWISILQRRHEKGYGVKGMPECHKKKFGFLWKNKSIKRQVLRKSRIFFEAGGESRA